MAIHDNCKKKDGNIKGIFSKEKEKHNPHPKVAITDCYFAINEHLNKPLCGWIHVPTQKCS